MGNFLALAAVAMVGASFACTMWEPKADKLRRQGRKISERVNERLAEAGSDVRVTYSEEDGRIYEVPVDNE